MKPMNIRLIVPSITVFNSESGKWMINNASKLIEQMNVSQLLNLVNSEIY